ncbi:MAG TPA: hypothetical protein VFU16_09840 [Solirubrobacterales bacterium]|nr:hypothetical protein [Solirubrobacterales bacterium]
MLSSRKLRPFMLPAAAALLAAALLAPSANAANIPPLSSSGQYQALVQFVDKLHGLAYTPTTASQKATFDGQLENKHEAAVNKSTALFNRAKKAAKAEADRAFKVGVRTIRTTEANELAGLRSQYDTRLDQAANNYEAELGKIEDEFDTRVATLRKEIKKLRNQKANANSEVQKTLDQEAIDRRLDRITGDRKLEQEEIADLKAGYRKEKETIRAAKASATQLVQQDDDTAVERLRNDHNRIYNARVRTLQSRRANQLSDLEAKLAAGRAAIEKIPVSG